MKLGGWTLVATGGVVAWYLLPLLALKNFKVKLRNFEIAKIEGNYIDVYVTLLLTNPGMVGLTVQSATADVYINDTYVSTVAYTGALKVPAGGSATLRAPVRLSAKELGLTLWQMIIDNNFIDSVITLDGSARISSRTFPFRVDLKIKDL